MSIDKPKTKEIAVNKTTFSLTNPQQVKIVADRVQEFLKSNNLIYVIEGKNYAPVEGWQFAGGLFGLAPKVIEVKDLSNENEIKYSAVVEIRNLKTKDVEATGYGLCSNKETRKSGGTRWKDEYAVISMCQTRAIGKAYRNLIGWLMKMSSVEGTPAEEMPPQTKQDEKTQMKITIDETIKMIRAAKDRAPLLVALRKIEKATEKSYTKTQKEMLIKEIGTRLDVIDNTKS